MIVNGFLELNAESIFRDVFGKENEYTKDIALSAEKRITEILSDDPAVSLIKWDRVFAPYERLADSKEFDKKYDIDGSPFEDTFTNPYRSINDMKISVMDLASGAFKNALEQISPADFKFRNDFCYESYASTGHCFVRCYVYAEGVREEYTIKTDFKVLMLIDSDDI